MSETGKSQELSSEVGALMRYVESIAEQIDHDPSLSDRRDILLETFTRLDEAVSAGQIPPKLRPYITATILTQTEAESDIDSLTKIYNRNGLKRRFGEEVARFRREIHQGNEPPPISVCFMDVDGFKEYNDSSGHPAGDQLLINIAAALRILRGEDIVGRIGGDEFMVILPGIEGENAKLAMGRVQAEMHKRKLPVTCSVGVVQINKEYRWEKLYPRVDDALYQAKDRGGNRVVLWEKGMPEKMPEKIV